MTLFLSTSSAICAVVFTVFGSLWLWGGYGAYRDMPAGRDRKYMLVTAHLGAAFCFFAAYVSLACSRYQRPYVDETEYRVMIGSDNEAVFLGGQAEKYSLEYRVFRRWKAEAEHVWLPNEMEKP